MTDITTAGVRDGAHAIDDLFYRDDYTPIVADDLMLEEVVRGADLPSLLVALAAVTHDMSILRPGLRPPMQAGDIGVPLQGGLTEAQQHEAREVALEALKRVRDEKLTSVGTLTDDEVQAIVTYVTNDGNPAYAPMLLHEVDVAPGYSGKPTWTLDEIAEQGQDFSVAVFGAGASGMAAGYRLKQAGVPFVVFEKDHNVGGTWWKNTYPGVRLDTPTYGYSFSFAQRTDWPRQFALGGEIDDYMREVVRRSGLDQHIEFGTEVVRSTWNESTGMWDVLTRTHDGTERVRSFNAIMPAVGQLDRPKFPDVPGRDTFAGAQMHSAEWDHSVDYRDKRVAVIGTGASAYQIVPAIVDEVESLTVFQRSSPWMLPTPSYYDDMTTSFQWLIDHLPSYGQWFRFWVLWGSTEGRAHTVIAEPGWDKPGSVSATNERVREALIELVREQYTIKPELVDKVIPDYPPGAKRMLRDNGVWAYALQRPQTTLVTDGIARITPTSIVTHDGTEHEVDIIVYATGFLASEFLEPLEFIGRDGVNLHEYWGGDAKAYLGISVPNFPNMFIVSGPNTGHVVNGSLFLMVECAVEYALEAIKGLVERRETAIDLKQPALDEFVEKLDAASATKSWGRKGVNTWYQNKFGRVSQIWPFTVLDYWERTRTPDLDKYEVIA